MKLINLLLLPLFLSFWDCNKPREPSQPVSRQASVIESKVLETIEWQIKKVIQEATWP
jgi:hypothetical protein